MSHVYVSTACYHGRCKDCRKSCKFCDVPCECDCHDRERPKREEE